MYNGIGLRTVRGSGTNGYVQRNLSYVNASRTRQTLVHNQRGGSSGGFGVRGGGKNRLPPNADILLHEKKRKVELQLLEMSLEMEERDCDPEEIQDTVKRERERLLTRLNDGGDEGQEKAKDVGSSHARQKRKEEENKRIKDAFGIVSDYMVGESFDPEIQERHRQERKERREQGEKERKERREKEEKERKERREKEEKERAEARRLRLKVREEKDEKTKSEAVPSRSRSELVSRSRRSHSLTDRRGQGRDAAKSRESRSRSLVTERRRLHQPSAADKRKCRSVSSSRSSSSSRSRSRSRSRKFREEKRRGEDSQATKKIERLRSRSARRSDSSSSSASESRRSCERFSRKTTVTKSKKLLLSALPTRYPVLKGNHKVLNLSKRSASVCVVTNDESHDKADAKKEKRSLASPERKKSAKGSSPVVAKREVKHEASSKQRDDEAKTSLPASLPVRVKREEKTEVPRSPRRSPSAVADSRPQSRKRKLRSTSPEDRRRRGRSTSSASSKASRSSRYQRMRLRSAPSDRSQSHSSDSSRSRSRSRSKSRSRRPSLPRRRGGSPSRSRSRGRGRSNRRSRRY